MPATDGLLANNTRYAEAFAGPVPGRPSLSVAVVACMDARMDVYSLLGLPLARRTCCATPAAR